MKNKFNIIKILIFLIIFYNNSSLLLAEDILIDAETVDIKEKGNLITASGAVSINDADFVQITGNFAEYNRIEQTVEIIGDVVFFDKEKNYKVLSDKIIFKRNENIISAFGNTLFTFLDKSNANTLFEVSGENSFFNQNIKILEINKNVVLKDLSNDYKIYSEKIIYNKNDETFKSFDKTKLNYKNEFIINTKDLSYNKTKNIFNSEHQTTITDNLNNTFVLSNFSFNLNNEIFKAEKIKLSDEENNILELKNGFVDLKSNELVGSDFNLNFNKNVFGNPENDPRLVGRYIITNKSVTTMKKSSFTTCKNVKGKCPSWSISADEVTHKKEKKRIEYKNAWLEIYDVPVAYFPYFFHPDPTVERQSGFLFPQFINSSNLGFSTQIPYFKAIDHDKDMTISPRVYSNNNLFIQSEYRQAFKNSKFITDFSYNKKDNSNSHLFATLIGDFEDSFYEMKLETVSNKNYLKKYQIQSPLINNYSTLNSSLTYEKESEDYSFSSSLNIIEDLSKERSDRYEYELPNYVFSMEKTLNDNLFNTFNFNSSGNYKKYNTNVDEIDVVNDFLLTSSDNGQLTNLDTDLKLLFRNINTYGDLSTSYKEDADYRVLGSVMLNLKYPLFKDTASSKNYLTPIASLRYSPNKGLNIRNEKTHIKFEELFILDRINTKTVETGASASIGMEYTNQDNLNNEKLKLGIGINFRNKEDEDLPLSSSLGKKTSDLIGYSGINITENLSFNYDFSINQNLSETNYSLISANYKSDRFKTSFEYMEKSNFIGDESYLNNLTEFKINKSNLLAFETNKNIDKNLTNYYNLIYQYKNDCLQASVVYNKQFYQEDTVNPGKNIFFKISFIPFGTINTPSLNE